MKTDMPQSIAAQWRRSLIEASPAYWAVQIVVAVSSVLFLWTMLAPALTTAEGKADPMSGMLIRAALDSLLFFVATHAGIRPLLRIAYVQQTPGWRAWLGLAGWLVVLAAVTVVLGVLIDSLEVTTVSSISAIRFQAGDNSFGVALQGRLFYLVAVFNLFSAYAIWAAIYLGYKALQGRRRLQAQLREARLRQLTHQLSPHFLFNTFNSIRGLIFEDQQRAAQLVTQLSELFRVHLQHTVRTEQTLEEEWHLAQCYLDIEAARLETRLRLHVALDPVCLSRRVPALSLLCLVENAIKHGIAPNRAPGWLRVSARPLPAGWVLEISNSIGDPSALPGTGTGLANLRERLQLGFAGRAQLQVEPGADRFTVRLTLPH
jgi:hypothetical protein